MRWSLSYLNCYETPILRYKIIELKEKSLFILHTVWNITLFFTIDSYSQLGDRLQLDIEGTSVLTNEIISYDFDNNDGLPGIIWGGLLSYHLNDSLLSIEYKYLPKPFKRYSYYRILSR